MNVSELIQALTALGTPDAPVHVEGCDCINPASGVEVQPASPAYVLITANLEAEACPL